MEEFRIVPQEELERETLFKEAVEALESQLNVGRIEYELSLVSSPPLIILNNTAYDSHVKKRVFELFHGIFDDYLNKVS